MRTHAGCSTLSKPLRTSATSKLRGTHLMHLEAMRAVLYHETNGFLLGEDQAPSPLLPVGGISDVAAIPH
jgi:hypothetical protein